jgi:hypothetical protein
MRRLLGVVFVGVLLTTVVLVSQRGTRTTDTGTAEDGNALAVFSSADDADPYEAYFSGHWCNCWRKTKISPPEVAKIFEGVLPRSHSPSWGKHKTVDMSGATAQEMLLMQAFEGLVGRRVPMWYMVEKGDFWYGGDRAPWNDGITGAPLVGIFGPNAGPLNQQVGFRLKARGGGPGDSMLYGIKRFTNELQPPDYINGAVIYDGALLDPNASPAQPREIINVVRTIAGVEGALPLTPELYQALTGQMWDKSEGGKIADRFPLPVIFDAREMTDWEIAQFGGNEAEAARTAQTWLLNTEWDHCLQHALCFVPPLGPGQSHGISDYGVEFGMFTFYVGGDTKGDERQLELVLSKAPFNIPIVGTITDKTGEAAEADRVRLLRLFSRFGKYFVDTTGCQNVSLHTSERPVERASLAQKPVDPVTYEPGKLYVAFALTAGNSLGHLQQVRPYHWDCASRGDVPVGWAVPLTAADALPNVLKYYYQEALNTDCFIADMSGIGRINPLTYGAASNDPKAQLAAFLKQTDAYMGYTGINMLWAEELDEATQELFAGSLDSAKAMIYGTQAATDYLTRSAYSVAGKPVLHTVTDLADSKAALQQLPGRLAEMEQGFALVGIDETQFSVDEDVIAAIADAAGELPGNTVVVRPDQLAALYQQAAQAKSAPTTPPELHARWRGADSAVALKRVDAGAITLDGSFAEWTDLNAPKIRLTSESRSHGAQPAGAGDLSAEAYAAYDDEYLYLAAHVKDDVLYVDDYNVTAGDGLELLIDARRGRFREPRISDGAYRMFITPAAGLVEEAELSLIYPTFDIGLVSMNKHGIEEKIATRHTRDGYDIEAAIPLANFPKVAWKKGERLAFALAVNDQDKGRTVERRLQSCRGDVDRSMLYLQTAVLN